MPKEELIPASEFCIYHQVELSFLLSLKQNGMIEGQFIEEQLYLPADELERVEKMVRLHYEMDINLEGIETITYLLQRMHAMQEEITTLTNRLKAYDPAS